MASSPVNSLTRIVALPLSPDLFRKYGAVLTTDSETGRSVNEGRGIRIDRDLPLRHGRNATKPSFAIYRIGASSLPVRIVTLERHPLSSQVFVPMAAGRFLVAVALPDASGKPKLSTLAAFEGTGGQLLVYSPGVWHLPLVAVDVPGTFAMFMWSREDGGPEDEFIELADQIEICTP